MNEYNTILTYCLSKYLFPKGNIGSIVIRFDNFIF